MARLAMRRMRRICKGRVVRTESWIRYNRHGYLIRLEMLSSQFATQFHVGLDAEELSHTHTKRLTGRALQHEATILRVKGGPFIRPNIVKFCRAASIQAL